MSDERPLPDLLESEKVAIHIFSLGMAIKLLMERVIPDAAERSELADDLLERSEAALRTILDPVTDDTWSKREQQVALLTGSIRSLFGVKA
ncbi:MULTISPECIES: hypothetical protein [Hydrocarboniphaga]|uniref:hypothetical protein n=1 Tax=Hydrocarboniphaga TaxID=243627 RepID=UPI0012F96D97|nr:MULTISPECIES: hypothetical protein [Hydrocarboniphaga]MDZ4077191.1 hypothetical protein [Hydrocarboniphaga sp.]